MCMTGIRQKTEKMKETDKRKNLKEGVKKIPGKRILRGQTLLY